MEKLNVVGELIWGTDKSLRAWFILTWPVLYDMFCDYPVSIEQLRTSLDMTKMQTYMDKYPPDNVSGLIVTMRDKLDHAVVKSLAKYQMARVYADRYDKAHHFNRHIIKDIVDLLYAIEQLPAATAQSSKLMLKQKIKELIDATPDVNLAKMLKRAKHKDAAA